MVGRPSVENWSRPELEDQFHSLYQQLQSTQKKANEQNKKLTQLNTRFRRSLLDRKTKEEGVIEKDKYDEIMRENQLLAMKLKSAKHQLLTYTTPTARASTASAMTGRSTFRPMSSVRRYPLTAHSTVERSSRIETTGSEAIRAPTVRINESSLADKAGYIKLNRLVRERNAQVAQLQFEIERLNSEVHDLRSELEKKSASVLQLETAAKIADKSLGKNGEQPAEIELDLIKKQLDIAVSENVVLKEANERLVKQSLSMDYESEAIEQVELKKEIAMLQERLKEAERRESELQRKLKREKQSIEEMRDKEKVRPSKSNQEEKNKCVN
uniref:C2-C2_1 domain-containing protein n=1 Tax=Heterorhabditis bacteriophora TaxID=37862 RepID=A0A1I7X8S4_HETBA